MTKEKDNKYINDFNDIVTVKLYKRNNEDYIQKEQKVMEYIKTYLRNKKEEEMDVDKLFDIIVDFTIFLGQCSYQMDYKGCNTLNHEMKNLFLGLTVPYILFLQNGM